MDMEGASRAQSAAIRVVVPVYNEEASLPAFFERLTAALEGTDLDWGVLFVDDGSKDRSPELMAEWTQGDRRDRVELLRLARNFGKESAVAAGLQHASADAVVMIDADLQDPPELIPDMVERWKAGADIVTAIRADRSAEPWSVRTSSRVFHDLFRRMTHLDLPPRTGEFRLLDRRVVEALNSMPERYRYTPGLIAWVGFDETHVPFAREPRHAAESRYPLRKRVRLAVDALTGFSHVPLQLATVVGFSVALLSMAAIPVILVLRLVLGPTGPGLGGQTAGIIVTLFLGGLNLTALGVLGAYVARIYEETKRRPLYVLRHPPPSTRDPAPTQQAVSQSVMREEDHPQAE